MLQVWSQAYIQPVDRVGWPIPSFGPVCWGSQQQIQVRAHLRFQVRAPRPLIEVCAQAAELLIWMHTDSWLWACVPRAAGPLIRFCAHPGFQLWATRPLIGVCTHWGILGLSTQAARPLIMVRTHPGFQLWAPSPLIWLQANRASGVCWGCLSRVHSPGAER